MKRFEKIEKAIELLKPIKYEPNYVGYYVLRNGEDMCGEDYCENCIDTAVKEARNYHKEQRKLIKAKYDLIETKGYCFHNGRKKIVKGKYTVKQIKDSKRSELKEYPAKAKFTYEGHDTDFGGGRAYPLTCENCGEYFDTNFEPSSDEAKFLLEDFKDGYPLSESLKWKLDIAFSNYTYLDEDAKTILLLIAEKIIAWASI